MSPGTPSEVCFLDFFFFWSNQGYVYVCVCVMPSVCHFPDCHLSYRTGTNSKEQQVLKGRLLLVASESHCSLAAQVFPVIEARGCREFYLLSSFPILWVTFCILRSPLGRSRRRLEWGGQNVSEVLTGEMNSVDLGEHSEKRGTGGDSRTDCGLSTTVG